MIFKFTILHVLCIKIVLLNTKNTKCNCAVPTIAIFVFLCHCFTTLFFHPINFINLLSHILAGYAIIHSFERNPYPKNRFLCS